MNKEYFNTDSSYFTDECTGSGVHKYDKPVKTSTKKDFKVIFDIDEKAYKRPIAYRKKVGYVKKQD